MFEKKISKGILLAKVNFPLYAVKVLTERHILVAGGGGKGKTGVQNAVEIYELIYSSKYNTCISNLVSRYDSKDLAFMNACVFADGRDYILAAGATEYCVLHRLRLVSNNITRILNGLANGSLESADNRLPIRTRRH